jgi:hypothetical protein
VLTQIEKDFSYIELNKNSISSGPAGVAWVIRTSGSLPGKNKKATHF